MTNYTYLTTHQHYTYHTTHQPYTYLTTLHIVIHTAHYTLVIHTQVKLTVPLTRSLLSYYHDKLHIHEHTSPERHIYSPEAHQRVSHFNSLVFMIVKRFTYK